MINTIWLMLIISGSVAAMFTGNMDQLSDAIFNGLEDTVIITIKLIGPLALWSGVLKIARDAKLINFLSKLIKPIFKRLFPEIPEDNSASGSILLNLSANILGLGNSATPLGIMAMKDLQKLNNNKTTASPAMCTLLALNTSSITLVPTTIISLRAAHNSQNPSIIIITTIFATTVSTITAFLFDRTFRFFYRK